MLNKDNIKINVSRTAFIYNKVSVFSFLDLHKFFISNLSDSIFFEKILRHPFTVIASTILIQRQLLQTKRFKRTKFGIETTLK